MLRLTGKVAIVTGSSSGSGKAIALILFVLFSGCGLMMIGPPAEKIDVESGTTEQKNLEAIRAMQADPSGRSAPAGSFPGESKPCATDGVVGQRCAER